MVAAVAAMAVAPAVVDGDRFRAGPALDRAGGTRPALRTRSRLERRRRCEDQGDGAECEGGLQYRSHGALFPLRACLAGAAGRRDPKFS